MLVRQASQVNDVAKAIDTHLLWADSRASPNGCLWALPLMRRTVSIGLCCLLVACTTFTSQRSGIEKIQYIIVIYAENRSFDHLYGLFPGADGIAQATAEQKTQLDHDGKPLPHLPATYEGGKPRADLATQSLPNGPFRIDAAPLKRRWDELLPSPIHNYYQNREQINGGANNK